MALGITVDFNANMVKFSQQMDKMQSHMDKFQAKAEGAAIKINSALSGLGVGLSVAGLSSQMLEATRTFESLQKSLEVTSGSAEKAALAMDFIRNTSVRLGTDLAVSAKAFSDLQAAASGTVMEGDNTRAIFTAVSQAMAALGKTSAETEGALLAIGQMMSKGTVSAEELRGQLGERLPGAFNVMAKALNVSTEELSKLLEQGKVGIDVLPRFAAELDKAYSGAKFDNIEASLTRIGNAWDRLLSSSGQAIKLDVVLKAMADIVTPEASNRYADLVERRNRLNSMIGRREGFGVEAAEYKRELAAINKELDAMDRKQAAADKFNPRFGAPMASIYAEYDDIIAQGQKLAEWQKIINQGQSEAQERLWTQNRRRIEERQQQAEQMVKLSKAESDHLQEMFERTQINLQKEISLRGDNSAAAEMEFEVQFGALSALNDAQKVRLLNLSAEKDFIEQNAQREQARWDQLISDANEFVDVTKAIKEFAAGDVNLPGFNGILGRIKDDLDAGIISAEQAKQKFDELGKAFNEGFTIKAKDGAEKMSTYFDQAARNMQSSLADFLFDPFEKGMDGMLESFVTTIRRMSANAAAANIMEGLVGDGFAGKDGAFGGLLGNAIKGVDWGGMLSGMGSFFGFADGGIMTSSGPLPLHAYATGGIANTPQLALFGEGRLPEAFVPLPDGRRIPVKMDGGGKSVVNHVNVYISTPNADSFRRSERQIRDQLARAMNT